LFRSARRIIALTDEQRDALMTTSVGGADPDLWLFVAFGLNTAMRHSEIMSARWDRLGVGYLSPSPRPASASSQSPLSWAELPERECESATTAKAGSSHRCATHTSMAGKSTRPSG
jgi:integrase